MSYDLLTEDALAAVPESMRRVLLRIVLEQERQRARWPERGKERIVNELSLFTGAGGGAWASRWLLGWTCVGYVESDDHRQRCIVARVEQELFDGHQRGA